MFVIYIAMESLNVSDGHGVPGTLYWPHRSTLNNYMMHKAPGWGA